MPEDISCARTHERGITIFRNLMQGVASAQLNHTSAGSVSAKALTFGFVKGQH